MLKCPVSSGKKDIQNEIKHELDWSFYYIISYHIICEVVLLFKNIFTRFLICDRFDIYINQNVRTPIDTLNFWHRMKYYIFMTPYTPFILSNCLWPFFLFYVFFFVILYLLRSLKEQWQFRQDNWDPKRSIEIRMSGLEKKELTVAFLCSQTWES